MLLPLDKSKTHGLIPVGNGDIAVILGNWIRIDHCEFPLQSIDCRKQTYGEFPGLGRVREYLKSVAVPQTATC